MRPAIYLGDHTALAVTRFGDKIYVDTRDTSLAPHIMLEGDWEPWVTNAFVQKLAEHPGATVFDVGANVGWYTLLACRFGSKSVVAFEPQYRLAELLRQSIVVNGYGQLARVHQEACGATASTALLEVKSDELGGAKLLDTDGTTIPGGQLSEVGLTRLDFYLPSILGPVVILKVDVEGFEPEVLAGILPLASKHVVLFLEHHRAEKNVAMLRSLKTWGFDIRHVRHTGHPSAPLSVEDAAVLGDAETLLCEQP